MINYTPILQIVPQTNHIDTHVLNHQIGRANMLAISGGRSSNFYQCTILPVAYGYHVVISLNADDTYKVQRVFMRAGKATVKAEWASVYADQIGEVAYAASLMEAVSA